MARQALTLMTGTLRDVANELGVEYNTMRAYAQGQRTIPPETLQGLAKLMRRRGKALAHLAERMEGGAQ
jgi:transcriptional regulator with XRE-family HTH domain